MSTATQTKELSYRKYIWLKWLTLVVMLGLMFVAVVLSLAAGSAALSIPEIVQALFLRGEEQGLDDHLECSDAEGRNRHCGRSGTGHGRLHHAECPA